MRKSVKIRLAAGLRLDLPGRFLRAPPDPLAESRGFYY